MLIREGIMTAANAHLPHTNSSRKIRDLRPDHLVLLYRYLKLLSSVKMRFSSHHIANNSFPSTAEWSDWFSTIVKIAINLDYKFSAPFLSNTLSSDNVSYVKEQIDILYKLTYATTKLEQTQYRNDSIKDFLQQRCENYSHNQKLMIDSVLNRSRKTIILDRIIVRSSDNSNNTTLITDPEAILHHTNLHFQTVAGGMHRPRLLEGHWID